MAAEKIVRMMLNVQVFTLYVWLIQGIQLEDFKAARDDGGTAWKKPGSLNYYTEESAHC